jgi:hypothetical protein
MLASDFADTRQGTSSRGLQHRSRCSPCPSSKRRGNFLCRSCCTRWRSQSWHLAWAVRSRKQTHLTMAAPNRERRHRVEALTRAEAAPRTARRAHRRAPRPIPAQVRTRTAAREPVRRGQLPAIRPVADRHRQWVQAGRPQPGLPAAPTRRADHIGMAEEPRAPAGLAAALRNKRRRVNKSPRLLVVNRTPSSACNSSFGVYLIKVSDTKEHKRGEGFLCLIACRYCIGSKL